MKKCPYCAEEIQDEAIKCRYCGGMLGKVTNTIEPQKKEQSSSQISHKKSNLLSIIIVLIICFFLIRGCKNLILSIGKESDDPRVRAETQRLEENIKGIGDAFWKGLTGQ